MKKTSIFFAIPCGEFFKIQHDCIHNICNKTGIEPIIIEEHSQSKNLWKRISDSIDNSDYFVADISSRSPNVILELGYTIKSKSDKYYAVFNSSNIEIPVDLKGFTIQVYNSIDDFQKRLIKWIENNVRDIDIDNLKNIVTDNWNYRDDFKDFNTFKKLWSTPPDCAFKLDHKGLTLSNSHMPIMTNHCALLNNFELEFKANVIMGALGFVLKGTKRSDYAIPRFCVMFNINKEGYITPHIFNENKINPSTHYEVFEKNGSKVPIEYEEEGWFILNVKVLGDKITIQNKKNTLLDIDMKSEPFKNFYDFSPKEGNIGFRCHPGELGIINYIEIKEII
jgi:hypothetical protein